MSSSCTTPDPRGAHHRAKAHSSGTQDKRKCKACRWSIAASREAPFRKGTTVTGSITCYSSRSIARPGALGTNLAELSTRNWQGTTQLWRRRSFGNDAALIATQLWQRRSFENDAALTATQLDNDVASQFAELHNKITCWKHTKKGGYGIRNPSDAPVPNSYSGNQWIWYHSIDVIGHP